MGDDLFPAVERQRGQSTSRRRLDAVPAVLAKWEDFKLRLAAAAGDVLALADLMAEAIAADRHSRGLDPVGRDGRAAVNFESLGAAWSMDAAAAAYREARKGSNNA